MSDHGRNSRECDEEDPYERGGLKRVRWTNEEDPPSPVSSQHTSSEENFDSKARLIHFRFKLTFRTNVFVAVTGLQGRVGGAHYNPNNSTLYLAEDTTDAAHFDFIKMFLEQTKPDTCLVSSRADEPLIIFCQEYMELAGAQCQVRPHREFVAQKGRDKLQQLCILAELPQCESQFFDGASSPTASPQNLEEFIQSRGSSVRDPMAQKSFAAIRRLNFGGNESPLCMAATASLLDQLLRVHTALNLDESQNHMGALDIRNIEILALDQAMQINADALSSLQIFDDENHASVHSDKTKEGHSLFQLINHTSTHLGRALLRRWCLRPSLSISIISARHAAVECLIHPDNIRVSEILQTNLRGWCQVPNALALLRTGRGRLSEWRAIAKFSYHVALLRESVCEIGSREEIGVFNTFLTALEAVNSEETGVLINTLIDWEESQTAQRICINPGVNEELDEQKRAFGGLDSLLARVARDLVERIPDDCADELRVLYFPQIGYLICIPHRTEHTPGDDAGAMPDWIFQFKTEESAYYKSQEMKDLDIHVGDLHSSIAAYPREIEIIEDALVRVLQQDKAIITACEVAAELDCLLSLAFSSRLHDWVKPEMTEDNIISIQGGHHPLQVLQVSTFVPNDTHLVGGRGIGVENEDDLEGAKSIMILTGANACGKSVYLKQSALIVFMAQIGCFVPAQSAKLGITDKIFTRVQTQEGVSKLQSSFMIDLSQISLSLRNSTARSLIVMDEFGKGSLSNDGAGLFAGVIMHLLRRGKQCPKVLASTHFHELFTRGLIPPSLPVSYAYMNILLSQSNDGTEGVQNSRKEIVYLYKVTNGLCLESYAAECAQMYGLNSVLVERARYISEMLKRNEIGALLDENITEEETKELEECAETCKRFMRWKMSLQDEFGVKERLGAVLGR